MYCSSHVIYICDRTPLSTLDYATQGLLLEYEEALTRVYKALPTAGPMSAFSGPASESRSRPKIADHPLRSRQPSVDHSLSSSVVLEKPTSIAESNGVKDTPEDVQKIYNTSAYVALPSMLLFQTCACTNRLSLDIQSLSLDRRQDSPARWSPRRVSGSSGPHTPQESGSMTRTPDTFVVFRTPSGSRSGRL